VTPCQEAVANPDGVKACFVLSTDCLGEPLALVEVGLDLLHVMEHVPDDRIHVVQAKRGILLDNPFRRHPLAEGCDHGIEGHAALADAHDTVRITDQGCRFSGHAKLHE
jgi:hypothetical protein